ncbi:DNA adenine methylase [Conexibacter sp. CPCC 206217]|uniref:DNA adenine methylase n=1 Tax=Conexibacter sp. CPCC 206217 TaxID=3064574 RepID=UPI002723E85F|nr:DNA adenine methylase [Conexibacter sp. CPCC 206217]MDO8213458.1 DNA adenine methylase [Conexibacter sp. CPCC 206217]
MATPERRYSSPLRYPGGKGKVASYIKLVMLENDLLGCEYVEPYAGGASVALSLLFERYASHIHINDLNRSVFAFWKTVLGQPDELCRRIRDTSVDVAEWQRQRDIQRQQDVSDLDLAFSTFFLNRTSRSGIIGGGVIGGLDQTGRWKIDARYNVDPLIRRIEKIARHRDHITVTGRDTADYIRQDLQHVPDAFVYFDPPYYVKGRGLYENYYVHDDHAEVAALVLALEVPWVVSYDATPEIRAMYDGAACITYDLHYSAADRSSGSEVMFFSSGMDIPREVRPAGVPAGYVDAQLRFALPSDTGLPTRQPG